MVRLSVDVSQDVYNCLQDIAKKRQLERGGRASKAEILRELLDYISDLMCKQKGDTNSEIVKELSDLMCKEKSMNKEVRT